MISYKKTRVTAVNCKRTEATLRHFLLVDAFIKTCFFILKSVFQKTDADREITFVNM